MKYGKQYQETLSSSSFPDEWRERAIEYKQLKKVINNIAAELEQAGLTPDVLRGLLAQQQQQEADEADLKGKARAGEDGPAVSLAIPTSELCDDGASDASSFVTAWSFEGEGANGRANGKPRKRRRPLHAEYELAGTTEAPEPRIRIIVSSSSSATSGSEAEASQGAGRRFTELSASTEKLPLLSSPFTAEDSSSPIPPSSSASPPSLRRLAKLDRPFSDSNSVSGTGGDEDASEDNPDDVLDADDAVDDPMVKRLYGLRLSNTDLAKWGYVGEAPNSQPPPSPPETPQAGSTASMGGLDDDDADDESPVGHTPFPSPVTGFPRRASASSLGTSASRPRRRTHHRPSRGRREIVIPLASDTLFLSSLTQALSSLAALQLSQKSDFASEVDSLSADVSRVSSPMRKNGSADLYAWRDAFSLWVEAQIFESSAERDRGERTAEDADRRLKWFVDQVGKRRLAKQMRHRDARDALERFVALNVRLADLKRFGEANGEATRKLLKKHDKRTALTATADFPTFLSAMTTSTSDYNTLRLPGFPSLPHLLLSSLTTTLLPVIPSLDDYSCGICADVAFKPIRLDCGHFFCLRCLSKMQKRRQDPCPLCRSPVVMRADEKNLDRALLNFLALWFPKEVKAKSGSDNKESEQEDLDALGLDGRCSIS